MILSFGSMSFWRRKTKETIVVKKVSVYYFIIKC